eukprot:gene23617-31983_t
MKRARSCGNDRDSDDLDEISYNKRILSDRFCLLKITSGGVEDIGSTEHYTAAPEQNTSFFEGKGRHPSASILHSDEAIFPKFSRGRFKYARKVDFLIDEIIRKSRRTFCQSDEREITVPSSIGPQPTTDHALSIYHESSVVAEAVRNDREKIIQTMATSSQSMERKEKSSFTRKLNSYAGDSSHEDWGIEEIMADRSKEEGNAEEKMTSSSDEYCVDSEEDLSVEDVDMVESGHSDMEVATW